MGQPNPWTTLERSGLRLRHIDIVAQSNSAFARAASLAKARRPTGFRAVTTPLALFIACSTDPTIFHGKSGNETKRDERGSEKEGREGRGKEGSSGVTIILGPRQTFATVASTFRNNK